MMTVRESLKTEKREYADWLCYTSTGDARHLFHTDYVKYVDPEDAGLLDGYIVVEDRMMDEYDYSYSILANTDELADFERDYGDKDAKVLVMIVRVMEEEEKIAKAIQNSSTWDAVLPEIERLCELAGLEEEWKEADDMTAESVIFEAAEKLGVEVL